MGKWLDQARSRQPESSAVRVFSAERSDFEANDTKDTIGTLRHSPTALLKECGRALAGVDPHKPPDAYGLGRWLTLVDDAFWLFDQFGAQAVRDGWSAADLFGVLPGHDAWGGIADRLRGSRSLLVTADRACWRRVINDAPEQFNRGSYPDLVPLWGMK